jgi:outer membrane protein assembly factor BamB
LLALDPARGTPIWACPVRKTIGRALVVGRTVLAATSGPSHGDPSEILVIDLPTGQERSAVEAGFEVTAALAGGGRAYFAGSRGLICLSADGAPLWRAMLEVTAASSWSGDEHALVARDPAGRELWRRDKVPHGGCTLLALGDAVAQPDFDT